MIFILLQHSARTFLRWARRSLARSRASARLNHLQKLKGIAGGILDINLDGETVFPVADELERRSSSPPVTI